MQCAVRVQSKQDSFKSYTMQSSNIVKTLYEDCVQAIRLVIPYLGGHDISSFKNIALRLRLWGSGLFGGSIGLDSLLSPSPDNPSLLRRSVIGTWADIALILGWFSPRYPHGACLLGF